MVITAPRIGLPHLALQVSGEDFTDHGVSAVAPETPRVVLRRAKVELVKLVRSFVAEHRILELGVAVFVAEEEAKGMLGVVVATAVPAANSQTRVDLKTLAAVRVEQFDRRCPFPIDAVAARVDVDARGRIEQVAHVRCDRQRRDVRQCIFELWPPGPVVDNVRVHSIIQHLPVDRSRGPTGRRFTVGRLGDYVVEEDVGLRVDVSRFVSHLKRRGAKNRCFGDMDRSCIDRTVCFRGIAAVGGVSNRRAVGFCADC